jgi:hypothetical protein
MYKTFQLHLSSEQNVKQSRPLIRFTHPASLYRIICFIILYSGVSGDIQSR